MDVVRTVAGVFQLSKLRVCFQHIKKMSGLGLSRLKLENVGCQLSHLLVGSQCHQHVGSYCCQLVGSYCHLLVGSYCHQLVGCYDPHHHLRKVMTKKHLAYFSLRLSFELLPLSQGSFPLASLSFVSMYNSPGPILHYIFCH